jgi:DNA (cytosine-5)-methyltransferase 1
MKLELKKKNIRAKALELSGFTVGAHNIDEVVSAITKRDVSPKFIIVDLFCGAGGTSTGFEMTDGEALVIACVNHDFMAIKSHWLNHKHIAHFEEDIRTLELEPLVKLLDHYRILYPDAKIVLWASLECTNFSKAKGGQPRDADSRTLADHLDRYITALNPDYAQIENVVEFMSWGPLDDNGKPVSRKNGTDYMRWCNYINSFGYYNEWKEMNSADFGAYTSRNRLFGCFAKHGLPIAWPDPTHAKNPNKGTMFGGQLQKWKAVKDVLDFADEGRSIFGRDKELSDKTLERIYAGLIKYVAGGQQAFILKYNSTSKNGVHVPPSVEDPCPVIAAQNRLGLAFITKTYSGRPMGKVISTDGPAGTITCFGGQQLVQTQFLSSYYGNGGNTSTDAPSPTLTTKDRLAVVKPVHFLDKQYSGPHNHQSIEEPAGTVMTSDKHSLVTAEQAFIMPTNFDNKPTSIEDPAPTITANRKWHYLVNPSWGGNMGSTEVPCPVVVARQDKAPLYLVISEGGDIAIRTEESDTDCMRKIKEFMVLYGIIDIKMRMLKVPELLKIQGFPKDYKLEGNQSDQKKFIGNSVVPNVVTAWALAMCGRLLTGKLKVA